MGQTSSRIFLALLAIEHDHKSLLQRVDVCKQACSAPIYWLLRECVIQLGSASHIALHCYRQRAHALDFVLRTIGQGQYGATRAVDHATNAVFGLRVPPSKLHSIVSAAL